MFHKTSLFVFLLVLVSSIWTIEENSSDFLKNSEQLTSGILLDCSDMLCVKNHLLTYLNSFLDFNDSFELSKERSSENIDLAIFKRLSTLTDISKFELRLPEIIFDGAKLTYTPRHGIDIIEPTFKGRGILKKKLLLSLLLLLKLKLKMLLPIFVAIIGIKAVKALIISKLTLFLVIGFILSQVLKKSGMSMMLPSLMMTPAISTNSVLDQPPMSSYGVPMSTYGVPNMVSQSLNSYEPAAASSTWDTAANNQISSGPYARIWSGSVEDSKTLPYSAYTSGSSTQNDNNENS